MDRYSIYCTPEQTKKALLLGAPIETIGKIDNRPYIQNGFAYCIIPTAEQMILWLEEQGDIDSIEVSKSSIVYEKDKWQYSIWDKTKLWDCGCHGFISRQEATLAAIDAALDHLNHRLNNNTQV